MLITQKQIRIAEIKRCSENRNHYTIMNNITNMSGQYLTDMDRIVTLWGSFLLVIMKLKQDNAVRVSKFIPEKYCFSLNLN